MGSFSIWDYSTFELPQMGSWPGRMILHCLPDELLPVTILTASLEVLRETHRDDRLALIAGTDYHPHGECVVVGAMRRSFVSFKKTHLEAALILCT